MAVFISALLVVSLKTSVKVAKLPELAQQRTVPVMGGDTADTLSARILIEEHRAYTEAVGILLAGGWRVEGRRFVRSGNAAQER